MNRSSSEPKTSSDEIVPLLDEPARGFRSSTDYETIPKSSKTSENIYRRIGFQIAVVILTTWGHMVYQSSRKALSSTKGNLIKILTPRSWITDDERLFETGSDAESFLGVLDAVFLVAFALSSFVFGRFGDLTSPRLIFVIGLIISAISLFLFGCVSEWALLYNEIYYIVTYFIFGIGQGAGKAAAVKILSEWFPANQQGRVVGLFMLSEPLGRIMGSYLSSAVVDHGTEFVYLVQASLLLATAIISWFGIVSFPTKVGIDIAPPKQLVPGQESSGHSNWRQSLKKVFNDYLRVALMPDVIPYALSFTGIKMINYGFFFWLPLFAENALGLSEKNANVFSVCFDAGGVPGTILIGLLWDKLPGGRSSILILLMLLSSVCTFAILGLESSLLGLYLVLILCGLLHWSVFNAEGAIASTALGQDVDSNLVSSVTGITNGCAGLGAAVAVGLISVLVNNVGWNSVFFFFTSLYVVSALFLVPAAVRELKKLCSEREKKKNVKTVVPDVEQVF